MKFGSKNRLNSSNFSHVSFVALLSILTGACVSVEPSSKNIVFSRADILGSAANFDLPIDYSCQGNNRSVEIDKIGAKLFNVRDGYTQERHKTGEPEVLISGILVPYIQTSAGKRFSIIPFTEKRAPKFQSNVEDYEPRHFLKVNEAGSYEVMAKNVNVRSRPFIYKARLEENVLRKLSIGDVYESPYFIKQKYPDVGSVNKWVVLEEERRIIGYAAFSDGYGKQLLKKIDASGKKKQGEITKWILLCNEEISITTKTVSKYIDWYPRFSAKYFQLPGTIVLSGDIVDLFDYTPKDKKPNSVKMSNLISQLYRLMSATPENVTYVPYSVDGIRIQPNNSTLDKEIFVKKPHMGGTTAQTKSIAEDGSIEPNDSGLSQEPSTSEDGPIELSDSGLSQEALPTTVRKGDWIYWSPDVTADTFSHYTGPGTIKCNEIIGSLFLENIWCEVLVGEEVGYVFRGFSHVVPKGSVVRLDQKNGFGKRLIEKEKRTLFLKKNDPGWFKYYDDEKVYFVELRNLVGHELTGVGLEADQDKIRLLGDRGLSQLRTSSYLPPAGETVLVALEVPPSLSERDRSDEFTVDGCQTVQLAGHGYLMKCDKVTPKTFRMSKFNSVVLKMVRETDGFRSNKFKIGVKPGTIKGVFYAKIPATLGGHYRYDGKRLPLQKDLDSKANLIVTFTKSLENFRERVVLKGTMKEKCDISIQFDTTHMTPKSGLKVAPSCKFVSVSYPLDLGSPKITGCTDREDSGLGFNCFNSGNTRISLDWGKGWKTIKSNPGKNLRIGLKDIRAKWPFVAKDPWLDPKQNSADPCSGVPTYKPTKVFYCTTKDKCASGKIKTRRGGGVVMPSLKEVNWRQKNGLPKLIQVSLQRTSDTPAFKKNMIVPWKAKAPPRSLKELVPPSDGSREVLPVRVNSFDEVPPDMNAKFLVFDSLRECKASTKSNNWRPYHENFVRELTAHRCSYAKVTHGSKNVTPCVAPKRQKDKWAFNMYTEKYKGARHIILIANSKKLRQKGKKALEGLIGWLADLKKKKTKKPITLMSVDGDGRIRTLLRAEELKNLVVSVNDPNTAAASIRGRVKARLSFTGNGFRPLDNLIDLEGKMGGDIGRVLFVTDEDFPKDTDVPPRDLGTPLVWKDKKIDFAVLTTSRCGFWEKRARAKKCEHFGADPASQTRKLLNGFF
jgi:hypothetical protein